MSSPGQQLILVHSLTEDRAIYNGRVGEIEDVCAHGELKVKVKLEGSSEESIGLDPANLHLLWPLRGSLLLAASARCVGAVIGPLHEQLKEAIGTAVVSFSINLIDHFRVLETETYHVCFFAGVPRRHRGTGIHRRKNF